MSLYVARPNPVALAAAETRTVVQVIHGGKAFRVVEMGISFNGVNASHAPVRVDLCRQSTAGTSSALTIVGQHPGEDDNVATALQGFSGTEPTTGEILRTWYITPAGGVWGFQWPLGSEPVVHPTYGDARIALRCTTDTGVTVTCAPYLVIDE